MAVVGSQFNTIDEDADGGENNDIGWPKRLLAESNPLHFELWVADAIC